VWASALFRAAGNNRGGWGTYERRTGKLRWSAIPTRFPIGGNVTEPRTIDFSRYRVAEAIAELWAAGETSQDIGADYFGLEAKHPDWIVELIVAAHDRKGRFERRPA
jgi:hypothetical protein